MELKGLTINFWGDSITEGDGVMAEVIAEELLKI